MNSIRAVRRRRLFQLLGKSFDKNYPFLCAAIQNKWRRHGSAYYNVFGDTEDGKPRVGISYMLVPFVMDQSEEKFQNHSNLWRCLEIARIFRGLGYIVDAIDCYSENFVLQKRYSVFFGKSIGGLFYQFRESSNSRFYC